jgi:hypothetical protein
MLLLASRSARLRRWRKEIGVNLLLMPILVSLFGVGLFSIPALIGGAMLFSRATSAIGKRILIYSSCSLLVGVVCCWIGFALMLFVWLPLSHWLGLRTVLIDPPVAIFWASGPFGIVLGAILARRFLRASDKADRQR